MPCGGGWLCWRQEGVQDHAELAPIDVFGCKKLAHGFDRDVAAFADVCTMRPQGSLGGNEGAKLVLGKTHAKQMAVVAGQRCGDLTIPGFDGLKLLEVDLQAGFLEDFALGRLAWIDRSFACEVGRTAGQHQAKPQRVADGGTVLPNQHDLRRKDIGRLIDTRTAGVVEKKERSR